jgi:hypothetical protein
VEIFNTLFAITKTVQVEATVYCLLGEQNAARLSMKQFSDFICANTLDNRDTLLALNSYSRSDHKSLINNFTDIQQKVAALPLEIEETRPLSVMPSDVPTETTKKQTSKKEKRDEQGL